MAQFNKFDVMTLTLGADLATNGTAVFTYPTASPARAAAAYSSAAGAVLVASQGFEGVFNQGASNFSLVYGATTVTVTYLGATTIPAGTQLRLQAPLGAYDDLTDSTGGTAGAALAAGVGKMQYMFYTNLADITAADLITGFVPGFNGKILGVHAVVDKPATTGAKLGTLTPKINAVNVTGGALALTSANMTPQGVKVDGSAITALNVFGPTDTIGIVGSTVTAFVEGNGWIVLDVQNMDVANAFASLAARLTSINALLRAREIFPGQVTN